MIGLKARRLIAGLTQAEAAKAAGVSRTALSRWEAGKSSPTAETLVKLATIYKCMPGDFFALY